MDKSNDIKQLREQIRKLDEQLGCEMQVLYPTNKHTLVSRNFGANERRWHVCVCVGAGPGGRGLGGGAGVCGEPSQAPGEEGESWLRRGRAATEGSATTVSDAL